MTLFAEMFDSLAAPALASVLGDPIAARIEKPPTALDQDGQPAVYDDNAWIPVAFVDVIAIPLSGDEKREFETTVADVTHRVWVIPRVADVTTDMRVRTADQVLNIKANLDRRDRFNQGDLLCVERKTPVRT